MYTNAQYFINPIDGNTIGVCVNIDGVRASVPLDPANTNYVAIMALVKAGKLVIAPAKEPTK